MSSDELTAWCAEVDAATEGALGHVMPTASESPPVVALVGAFNTGKTAVLKRLLHVSGEQPDPGLIVGGDPTTFVPREVHARGLVLRDTPGLGSGRPGHDEMALTSAVDADALLILLTPQLLAAVTESTWGLLSGKAWSGHADDSDWQLIVVNRFDQAGADPATELEAYEKLQARKRSELELCLAQRGISPLPTIFVAGDPFGFVENNQLDSESYREGEGWDGFDRLLVWLDGVPARIGSLRSARAVRVRCAALGERRATLVEELVVRQALRSDAAHRAHSIEEHRRTFERLWNEADITLEEVLSAAVGDLRASDGPDRGQRVQLRVQAALLSWSAALSDDLHRLMEGSSIAVVHEAPPALGDPDFSAMRDAFDAGASTFSTVAEAISEHADQVREAAAALADLAQEIPRLKPVADRLSPPVVDAVIRLVTAFQDSPTTDDAVGRARAKEAHDQFMAAARAAAGSMAASLRTWADGYRAAMTTSSEILSRELAEATAGLTSCDEALREVDDLMARAAALRR